MAGRLMKTLVAFLLVFTFASQSFAQNATTQGEQQKKFSGPRRQLATIIFAGLGGAILGLSTLSFYGRPQDKLSNIAVGFAVGVIAGTTYVTYKAATNPTELYGTKPLIENELELSRAQAPIVPQGSPLGLQLAFEF